MKISIWLLENMYVYALWFFKQVKHLAIYCWWEPICHPIPLFSSNNSELSLGSERRWYVFKFYYPISIYGSTLVILRKCRLIVSLFIYLGFFSRLLEVLNSLRFVRSLFWEAREWLFPKHFIKDFFSFISVFEVHRIILSLSVTNTFIL